MPVEQQSCHINGVNNLDNKFRFTGNYFLLIKIAQFQLLQHPIQKKKTFKLILYHNLVIFYVLKIIFKHKYF